MKAASVKDVTVQTVFATVHAAAANSNILKMKDKKVSNN